MINQKKILAIIPARGGSKGITRKNIRMLGDRPLIAWTIEAAQNSMYVDRVIVSTDDVEIAEVASRFNCDVPFMREPELARDETPMMDVVIDAIQRCPGYDWVLLLQPSSPLRDVADIDSAVHFCLEKKAPSCVSIALVEESPYWMYMLNDDGTINPLLSHYEVTRRQDLPPVYSLNGAIYFAQADWLMKNRTFVTEHTIAYKMPAERSMDLDTESDFQQLQIFLKNI